MRHAHEDTELRSLVRRYVTPERRYLRLGGSALRLDGPERDRFVRDLGSDAGRVTPHEIDRLLEGGWRERRTAAWLIAVSDRTEFRERLGELLLASAVCCAGLAYCVSLARFGTPRDAELLAAYLDRYLRRPDLGYDQPVVMGALVFTGLNLGADHAAPFLAPGGLWHEWLDAAPHARPATDPAGYVSLIRRLCALADECVGLR
ncbi:hypothetical protein EDD93_1693 [Streptomyces sp. 840.1]|uniref:DUF6000 family protein n=1 Tax=Streptomyces sp. 840.1 TaxID=2485152 RepID=UPI000F490250|nr:DUF6000 family protein [Streptomyces sp. 840.1]ROQ67272.1 hypothetical protein EDD93_1693 [Streptomyces sp. 840.1]